MGALIGDQKPAALEGEMEAVTAFGSDDTLIVHIEMKYRFMWCSNRTGGI